MLKDNPFNQDEMDSNDLLKEMLMQPDIFTRLIHDIIPEASNTSMNKLLKIVKTAHISSMSCNLNGEAVELSNVVSFTLSGKNIHVAITVNGFNDYAFSTRFVDLKATCMNYFSDEGVLYVIAVGPGTYNPAYDHGLVA